MTFDIRVDEITNYRAEFDSHRKVGQKTNQEECTFAHLPLLAADFTAISRRQ